jgi:hypothetical protein
MCCQIFKVNVSEVASVKPSLCIFNTLPVATYNDNLPLLIIVPVLFSPKLLALIQTLIVISPVKSVGLSAPKSI